MEPELKRFFGMWQRRQRTSGNLVPPWRSFSPPELAPFSDQLVILEYPENQSQRIRLAGITVEEIVGAVGGKTGTLPAIDSREYELLSPLHRQALSHPCGYSVVRAFRHSSGRPDGLLSTIGLPALSASGRPEIILVCHAGIGNLPNPLPIPVEYTLSHLSFVDIGAGVPTDRVDFNLEMSGHLSGRRYIDE